MKNSFVLYTDHYEHIALLSMEERGELLTIIMLYQMDEELPEVSPMVKMAFSFIKAQLDKDDAKYQETCKKRAEAGKMGGRPKANGFDEKAKKANGFSEKQMKANESKQKQNNPDNEYDNDLKEKDTKVSKKKSEYTDEFETLWDAYPRRKEKQKAYKSYLARLKDGYSEDELLLAVKRYAEEVKQMKTEEAFIKHAATFFGANLPFVDYLGDYKLPQAKQVGRATKFSNAPERSYNMADLERRLLQ
jgi:hypothetical protein